MRRGQSLGRDDSFDWVPPHVGRSVTMTFLLRHRCPLHDCPLVDRQCMQCSTPEVKVAWLRAGYDAIAVAGLRDGDSVQQQGLPEAALKMMRTDNQLLVLQQMLDAVLSEPPADGPELVDALLDKAEQGQAETARAESGLAGTDSDPAVSS